MDEEISPVGSGNIFIDLGFPEQEAIRLLAESRFRCMKEKAMKCCDVCSEASYLVRLIETKQLSTQEVREIVSPELRVEMIEPQTGTAIYRLNQLLFCEIAPNEETIAAIEAARNGEVTPFNGIGALIEDLNQ